MTAPLIVDSYPASGSLGIPIGDSITVTFDQEIDEDSVNSGTFVLAAPANDTVFGPGLEPISQQYSEDRDDILTPPEFSGYVKGTITFSKIDASGSPVDDSEVDYTGARTIWRTVATFTPDEPLRPNVEYTVLLAGDEDQTNDFDSGIRNRTVFDPLEVVSTGTGTPIFSGGYTGTTTRTYVLEITGGGATGTATYEWWNQASPLIVNSGTTTTGVRQLEGGLAVSFGNADIFAIGDRWTVVVVPFEVLENNYSWTFSTGSGSVVTPPTTGSTSGINDIPTAVNPLAAAASGFYIASIDPAEGEYGVALSEDPYAGEEITITLSEALDVTTVDADTVTVISDSPLGDDSIATVTGELDYTVVASGSQITISLDPGQLYQNNIVVITLDSSIANTDGDTLGTDYISYFATTYTPLYSGIRRIMLDIGDSLPSIIKDETIYLAILMASLQADALTFAPITNQTFYNLARSEYVTCLAERTLLQGIGYNNDKLSKRLADLSVSRDGADQSLKDELASCITYWEISLKSGGKIAPDGSVGPQISVKGAWAEDRFYPRRLWAPTNRLGYSSRSAANSHRYKTLRRDQRTYRTRYNKGGS